MKHEFKVTKSKDQTVYTLESATGGGTSSGGNASVSTALGGVQRRPTDSIFAQEAKKEEPKPRNFVAKNAKMGGAGKMKDKSKTIPRHEKHKKPVAEDWSQKYKSSINCSHPKGFSQKAHCAGKNKQDESMMTMEAVCPDCGMCETHGNINEIKKGAKDSNGYTKCWSGYHAAGTKKSATTGKQVRNCVPNEGVAEDHEIQMASSELQSIAKNAVHLLDLVRKYSEEQGLDAWQQSKITKAADYLNSVLQSVSGEQNSMDETRDNYHANTTGFGRRPRDDERHDLDTQADPRETMMWNLNIDGEPLNPEPIMGRSNLIKFGKQQAASGVDLSNAVISPASNMEEDDSALQAFLSKGGKVDNLPYKEPRTKDKANWGSKHIGTGKGGKAQNASGLGANTRVGNKPVVSVEEDAYMMELAGKLAEKIPPNADVDYYINDFAKSTAPQFKGKNPAKRKQMAFAAYYGSKQKKK